MPEVRSGFFFHRFKKTEPPKKLSGKKTEPLWKGKNSAYRRELRKIEDKNSVFKSKKG